MVLTFLGIFILEYIIVAWEQGPSFANENFNSTLVIGGIFIVYYTHKLTNMDLVRGYWSSISLTSISNKRNDEKFNFFAFMGRLISGDIIPHSFVHRKIILAPNNTNIELSRFFTRQIKAEITDRVVVVCKSKRNHESYKDPYWFMIKTEEAFSPGTADPETIFLLRFRDARPSFEIGFAQHIYLFSFKNGAKSHQGEIKRDHLRALGKAYFKLH